ncbi:hypothetical protein [Phenylobacterium sp.]|jgi:hypothetical protein|uniref:hypothetical protein n=1 Tax=Phenylobacterium sp. TaxID=1871053 RepID=UPI002F3F09E3
MAAGLVLAGAAAAQNPPKPDWSQLAWLEGDWTAVGGAPGKGGFSFRPEAGGWLLVRRNFADYPAQGGKPAEHHEDLLVMSREGAADRATYWDSEGHVIHYAASAPAAGEALFVSDDPAGPRYRLSYRRTAGGLAGRFEIAPPNARDQFKTYLEWTAVRAHGR